MKPMQFEPVPPHLQRILNLARWAPSGDNTQPWRFEVLGAEHLLVHGYDTRDTCVYDLDGRASQLSLGALLETISLAASTEGRRASIMRRADTPETHPRFDVLFDEAHGSPPDRLTDFISGRNVERRAMPTSPLSDEEKAALERSVAPDYDVVWLASWAERFRTAALMYANGKIRLTMREAYEVHRAVIEWDALYSEDRIPDAALGVNEMTRRVMKWAMASWERVSFLNKWLMGHWLPRIEMDLLPGLRCAAHFCLLAPAAPTQLDDYVAAGRALQRFWLTAESLGLKLQPEMTPLIFARYAAEGRLFSADARPIAKASRLAQRFEALVGTEGRRRGVFFGRIGRGRAPRARSLRLPLPRLMAAEDGASIRPARSSKKS